MMKNFSKFVFRLIIGFLGCGALFVYGVLDGILGGGQSGALRLSVVSMGVTIIWALSAFFFDFNEQTDDPSAQTYEEPPPIIMDKHSDKQ